MKRSLKKLRKELEKENRQLFDKIIINIDSYSLNTIQREEIYEELLGIFVESENRNEYLSLVIGPDINEFCKELTKNAKRKTFLEKVISSLSSVSFYISLISILSIVSYLIFGDILGMYVNGSNLYINLFGLTNAISIYIIILVFQKLNSRNIFNKKIKSTIFIIYMVIYTATSMISSELVDKDKFIVINAIPYFISIIIITLGLWLLDKYISKKYYYN